MIKFGDPTIYYDDDDLTMTIITPIYYDDNYTDVIKTPHFDAGTDDQEELQHVVDVFIQLLIQRETGKIFDFRWVIFVNNSIFLVKSVDERLVIHW